MNEKRELRTFLIKRFLLILAFIGITEGLLNTLFHRMVYPWMNQVFGLNSYLESISLSEIGALMAKSVFFFCADKLLGAFPVGIRQYLRWELSEWAGEDLFSQIGTYAGNMPGNQKLLYTIGLFGILAGLLLLWLIPYVIAAFVFGIMVSKKAAELEEANRKKKEQYERQRNLLLSDVAHDLKTPITTVVGYAKALSRGDVTGEAQTKEYLDAIARKSMQMSELIQLLFEYVKLDSEGFSLKKEKKDLTELLREVAASLYMDFEEKEIVFEADIPEKPCILSLDVIQFSRAVHNLLLNIIRHNPAGTEAGIVMEETDEKITLKIWDNGTPIPPEIAEHLFEPFVQGDASRQSKSGSGLGLSIAAKVIAMHDGELTLLQENGKKIFKITLVITEKEH